MASALHLRGTLLRHASPCTKRAALCLLSLLACACGVPDPIWRGEHLHYGTTTRAPVCHGSFHRQEEHAVELARLLEIELSDVIHFTRVKSRQLLRYCGHGRYKLSGCALLDEPYVFRAGTSFDFHEITHAVAFLGGIQGPLPFAEGLAEVFDDGTEPVFARTPLMDVLNGQVEDAADYHTAARFVRFLIERHDLLTLADFMRARRWTTASTTTARSSPNSSASRSRPRSPNSRLIPNAAA